jgi:hypothetical protein
MFDLALCRCGCGEAAPIANENRPSRGLKKGQPRPFRRGHHWRRDPVEKFWEKVLRGDGCWEWRAGRDQKGYGVTNVDGKGRKAHRVSWELTNGPIPDGMQVCHHCDNPPCVRPDHLFLGTNQDNVDDAYRKGHFFNRLGRAPSRDEAHRIVSLRASGLSQTAIATETGLSRRTVQRVLDGSHWVLAA